ncbi:hypothetical protein F5B22DRAFT_192662 [Xylaria bambusicola]|uniref:uncharacterized protein n=1 Tax=Xylaria bambusicola TaxID=326684 RepID=UPI0020075D70|nr:uncharacterized protein F5B22DRAFT_192662 [Xylaria bambusicola]KAI0515205.1 hypothetical protein F5B22DRAFT_192662 [Xylaria bambusicola]
MEEVYFIFCFLPFFLLDVLRACADGVLLQNGQALFRMFHIKKKSRLQSWLPAWKCHLFVFLTRNGELNRDTANR